MVGEFVLIVIAAREDICETVAEEKWQSTMLFTQDTIDCEYREDKDLGR